MDEHKNKFGFPDVREHPWCPLFGDMSRFIPLVEESIDSPISRSIQIIKEGRLIWGISPDKNYGRLNSADRLWPKPKDIPGYPKTKLLTAQSIFYKVYDLVANAQRWSALNRDTRNAWFNITNNTPLPELGADQTHEDIITNVVNLDDGTKRSLKPHEVHSLMAILLAWTALVNVVDFGNTENSPHVLKTVQEASMLLAKAVKLKDELKIKRTRLRLGEVGKIVRSMQKDAELGRNTRRQRVMFARGRKGVISEKKLRIMEAALEIQKRHPEMTANAIAKFISEGGCRELADISAEIGKQNAIYKSILPYLREKSTV